MEAIPGRPTAGGEPTGGQRWLSRPVAGIGAASLLSDLGHEVPTALLPRLLTGLGGSAGALGLIEGVSDGLAGLMRLAGGALADDPGRRRKVVVGGYATTAILTSLIGAVGSVWQVGVLRAGGWAARGLRVPARNALLADSVRSEVYGRAYGFERAMDNLGAIGGPLLALALVAVGSVRGAILLSAIPGLLAAGAILYAVRHIPRLTPQPRALRISFRPIMQGRLGRLMISVGAFEVGNVAATLLILRATEALAPTKGPGSADRLALLLYLAYNVAAAGASLPAGRASDRFGSVVVLASGVGAFLIAYLGFAGAGHSISGLAVSFVLAGLGIGCVETAEHAAVAAVAPSDARGSAFGLLAAVQSFGNLAASGIAGLLWSAFSAKVAFTYLSSWMAVALIGMLAAGPGKGPPGRGNQNRAVIYGRAPVWLYASRIAGSRLCPPSAKDEPSPVHPGERPSPMAASGQVSARRLALGELLTVRQRDGSTIALEGELDLSNVEVFTAVLNPCCRDMDEHLSLDLSRLTFLDVSGLRALAQAAQTLDGRGKSWVLVSPSPLIRRLLELTGLLPAMANLKIQ